MRYDEVVTTIMTDMMTTEVMMIMGMTTMVDMIHMGMADDIIKFSNIFLYGF